VHFGSGALGWKQAEEEISLAPTLAIDFGLGTNPDWPVIVGGLMRIQPYVDEGTDLAWLVRGALGGFQSDWVGLAVDAGLYQRFWGVGSTGFLGEVVLGLPIGLQLTAMGEYGTDEAVAFGGMLGIDFVRLTTGRLHLLDWWPNPQPEDALDQRRAAAAPLQAAW
jgi:hypothetical protein